MGGTHGISLGSGGDFMGIFMRCAGDSMGFYGDLPTFKQKEMYGKQGMIYPRLKHG